MLPLAAPARATASATPTPFAVRGTRSAISPSPPACFAQSAAIGADSSSGTSSSTTTEAAPARSDSGRPSGATSGSGSTTDPPSAAASLASPYASSFVSEPERTTTTPGPASRRSRSASSMASSHETGPSPRRRTRWSGSTIRSFARSAGNANRPLSQSHPWSTSGWFRERIRLTFPSRVVTPMLQPTGQRPQIVGTVWISHGRASNRYSVDVNAPTGQSSITFPEKRSRYGSSSNVAISVRAPRLTATSSPSSATSSENRVQR